MWSQETALIMEQSETGKGLLALLRAVKAGHKLKAEKGN